MNISANQKDDLSEQIDVTRQKFLELIDSIPESDYSLPTQNPVWTVGDMLYHIALGPSAVALEIWMILYTPRVFQLFMNNFPARLFNSINAKFTQRGKQISSQSLIKAYAAGHKMIKSRLKRTRGDDLQKSIVYPSSFEIRLAGVCSVKRLLEYVDEHFEIHARELKK